MSHTQSVYQLPFDRNSSATSDLCSDSNMGSELSTQSQLMARNRRRPNAAGESRSATRGTKQLTRDQSGESLASDSRPDVRTESGMGQPIGSMSGTPSRNQASEKDQLSLPPEIVIVSKGETADETIQFMFPAPFRPLIPIGQESLPVGTMTADGMYLNQLASQVQQALKSKSEFIRRQQIVLCDICKDIESYSSHITNSTISDRHRKFDRLSENFYRIPQIDQLLDKIAAELETCLSRIQTINAALPEDQRLEPFRLPETKT